MFCGVAYKTLPAYSRMLVCGMAADRAPNRRQFEGIAAA